jgi:hypothetical protein
MIIDNPKGSLWHRWEPHIHIPGTILNNQYPLGDSALSEFCDRIEQSNPLIKVLGVTDYYSTDSYEKARQLQTDGRLKNVELIFPNIELRFKIGTSRDSAVNGHLIVSPEDPNHVTEIKRFLQNITFSTGLEEYHCNRTDLIKLGYAHDSNLLDDNKALETGTNQFKVDFSQLIKAMRNSQWAQTNILLGIAGGSNDGTSGLKNDASFSATRQVIERESHIIFGSQENQRLFWLGKGVLSKQEIEQKYSSCKPCIHGSDAHKLEDVGKPALNRYTWIKGDIAFESLRQICIEPDYRVFVGLNPPENQIASNVIDKITVTNSRWMQPSEIQLNSGLIAIIGARGSGKTALADMIASGGFAIADQLSKTSFIKRAYDHLLDVEVELSWKEGPVTKKEIKNAEYEDFYEYPRVQYLSQQFVDQLCSSEGMTDRLMLEIEKVIFNAHPAEEKLGVSDFQGLLSRSAGNARAIRLEQEVVIQQVSQSINVERAKKANLPALQKKKDDLIREIAADTASKSKLIAKEKDERLNIFDRVSAALDKSSVRLESSQNRHRSLIALKQAVDTARSTSFVNFTSKLQETNASAGLSSLDWAAFAVNFVGDVDSILLKKTTEAGNLVSQIKGARIPAKNDPKESYIASGQRLEDQSYEVLSQEVLRLKTLIGIDAENGKQYSRISDKIVKSETELEKVKNDIKDSEGAIDRISKLMEKRKDAYQKVFEAMLSEDNILNQLKGHLKLI